MSKPADFENSDSVETRPSLETITTAEEVTSEKILDSTQTVREQEELPEEVLFVGKIEFPKSARGIFVSRLTMPDGIKLLDIADTAQIHVRTIIALDTTLRQFGQFLEINSFSTRESNLFYWKYGTIYMKDFDSELMDRNQTRIHGGAITYFTSTFRDWSISLVTQGHSLTYMSDVQTTSDAVAIAPDVLYSLDDEDRVVIEICYATSFLDAHARMIEEYNAMPNFKAGIIVKIAYPIQNEGDVTFPGGIKYSVNDGAYVAIFYERQTEDGTLQAVSAISFGDTPLPAAFRTRLTFPTGLDAVQGYLETDVNPCDAAHLDDYIYRLPARALLLVNENDPNTITGSAVNQIPVEINLTIDLFELKQHIRTGIRQTNRQVLQGARDVVRDEPTLR